MVLFMITCDLCKKEIKNHQERATRKQKEDNNLDGDYHLDCIEKRYYTYQEHNNIKKLTKF